MNKIKGLLLDLDNTLYEYEPIHQASLSLTLAFLHQKVGLPVCQLESLYVQAQVEVKSRLPNSAASHSRLLYFQRLYELIGVNSLGHAKAVSDYYWTQFLTRMRLSADAKVFLDNVKHVPICLVTDLTTAIQYQKIKVLQLEKSIDFIVTSEEVGCEKPDAKIFQWALEKLKRQHDEVLMIGDNFARDIVGASELGIQTVWLNRGEYVNELGLSLCQQVHRLDEVVF